MRVLAIVFFFTVTGALAHEFYDPACCSDKDCAPYYFPIREEPDGFFIVMTNETIPYAKAKVSPDGRFHRCVGYKNSTKCLYAPPRGY